MCSVIFICKPGRVHIIRIVRRLLYNQTVEDYKICLSCQCQLSVCVSGCLSCQFVYQSGCLSYRFVCVSPVSLCVCLAVYLLPIIIVFLSHLLLTLAPNEWISMFFLFLRIHTHTHTHTHTHRVRVLKTKKQPHLPTPKQNIKTETNSTFQIWSQVLKLLHCLKVIVAPFLPWRQGLWSKSILTMGLLHL